MFDDVASTIHLFLPADVVAPKAPVERNTVGESPELCAAVLPMPRRTPSTFTRSEPAKV